MNRPGRPGTIDWPMSIERSLRDAVIDHAMRAAPAECCGLLIGSPEHVAYAVAMRNVERGRTRYRLDDREHIELRRWLRRCTPALAIQGVYHSHPASAPMPSPTDIAEAGYPDWLFVIVGLKPRPLVRGFRIRGAKATAWPLKWASSAGRGRR